MHSILFTEHETNLILEVAKSRSIPDLSVAKNRISNSMTADCWKGIAERIEKAKAEWGWKPTASTASSVRDIALGMCPEEERFYRENNLD